ncbi:hypothetical protein ACHAXH_010014 [Discostella pseudostelligera]
MTNEKNDPALSTPCVAQEARSLNLFSSTPLIYSIPLSKLCHPHPVFLKLDLLQPSGSFKDRGMAHLCSTVNNEHKIKLVASSGGNAGLGVATVARSLPTMEISVVVPETTKPLVIDKLRLLGAEVTVHGANWNIADALARQRVNEIKEMGGHAVPFDNPLLWTGHSTVVDEIISQLLERRSRSPNLKIGAILASVGGGGLLAGILEGIERNYCGSKVIACETDGTASFAASFNASSPSDISIVRLSGITSVATSLGCLEVTPAVIERSHRHQERGKSNGSGEDVLSYVCSDAEAIDACIKFATDHRMLVEPACGAALAPLYTERMRTMLLDELGRNDDDGEKRAIVVEVCGGNGVDLDILQGWKAKFLG